jgi:anaerobic selenocysteine-containing dehydrogenase
MPDSGLRPSRRRFAGVAATAAAGSLLTSCTSAEASTVKGACYHDCPDACTWIVTRQNGKLVRIEGDPNHPFTRGKLCPIMDNYLADIVYNPERVLHPMRRVGTKGEARFERVSWDVALREVAERLQGII